MCNVVRTTMKTGSIVKGVCNVIALGVARTAVWIVMNLIRICG